MAILKFFINYKRSQLNTDWEGWKDLGRFLYSEGSL